MAVRLSILDTTILATMAATNAVLELTLGNYLHLVKFPLTGAVMVGLNLIPYMLGYVRVPRRGAILSMGMVTALLNLFLGGSFKGLALPAIVAEAAVIDIIVSSGGMRLPVVILAGVASNVFSMGWALVFTRLVMGRELSETLLRYVGSSTLAGHGMLVVAVAVTAFHAGCGVFFALLAWRLHRLVETARAGAKGA